jgi:hypothetical protein
MDQRISDDMSPRRFKLNLMELRDFMRIKILSRIVNISEFMISFKPRVFFKFFIYHILFFYIGFFSLLIIVPIDNLTLANNMSFWITTKNKLHLYI